MTETLNAQQQKTSAYMVVWIILLIVISWPLAWFVCPFWVLLLPLEPFFTPVRELNEFLEKIITWPRSVGVAIYESHESFPGPMD